MPPWRVLLSLNVPVAVNLMDVPRAICGFTGLTLIETKWEVETVSPVDPLNAPKTALIVLLLEPWCVDGTSPLHHRVDRA